MVRDRLWCGRALVMAQDYALYLSWTICTSCPKLCCEGPFLCENLHPWTVWQISREGIPA